MLLLPGVTRAQVVIAEFSAGRIDDWIEKSFKGYTKYSLVKDGGISVLNGTSKSTASILFKEIEVDLNKTPVINWSWKIATLLEDNLREQERSGDDFSARVYVVYKFGFLPWDTLALNYVWASQIAIGTSWKSPYASSDQMIVLRSGDTQINQWQSEKRNVKTDFENFFNRDVSMITGVAVMVDTDNTHSFASARFGDIFFSEE